MKQMLACLVLTLGMGLSFNSAMACDCSKGKKCECEEGTCKCGKKKDGKSCGEGKCEGSKEETKQ